MPRFLPVREQRLGRSAVLSLLTIVLVLGAVLIAVSRHRLVDYDEGFYLLAAKSVLHGKLLYRDFFYTQMPLLPYVYGLWMRIMGETWESGRLLSALCATVIGCLLFRHVSQVAGSLLAGGCSVLMFVSNTYVLGWYPIAKTYSLSVLLLFAAYLILWRVSNRTGLFAGGLLLALSIDTRLFLVATMPVFVMCIYARRKFLPPLATCYAWFVLGIAAGLLPNLIWAVSAPAAYLFNNLGYHAVRTDAGLVGSLHQKIVMLLKISGLIGTAEGSGIPFGLLILSNALYLVLQPNARWPSVWPAMGLAAAIIGVSTLPTPTYQQYYCAAVPFLIVGAVTFAWEIGRSRKYVIVLSCALIAYLLPVPFELPRYLSSGTGIISVVTEANAVNWRLHSVREVSRQIDRVTAPGEEVFSRWPGDLLESHATAVVGTENDFGLLIAHRLSANQLRTYGILSESAIEADFEHHHPRVVILTADREPFEESLQRNGYRPVYRLGQTVIYAFGP